MGTIKIGIGERNLIEQIDDFKERYKARLEDVSLGLQMAEKQISDTKNEGIQRSKETVEVLRVLIEKMTFSEDLEDEKFWISWWVYADRNKQYQEYNYGKMFNDQYILEKEFVYAMVSWEKEICKRLTILRELQGNFSQSLWTDLENDLHRIIIVYIAT